MSKNEVPRMIKNIFINPPFQLKVLSYFIGLFVLSTISLYTTTFLLFWKIKQKALNVGIPDGHVFYKFLLNQKSDVDNLFIGLAVLNFILLVAVVVVVSHRIAGPIHKLKMHLEAKDLEAEDFKLRESDFFQELEPIVKNFSNKKP
jgi:hypothetical protein